MMKTFAAFCFVVCFVSFTVCSSVWAETFVYPKAQGDPTDLSFYEGPGDCTTLDNIETGAIEKVIVCIGDGMGFNEVGLARQAGVGLKKKLWMEKLPVMGAVRTFSGNNAVTDSAAAGTALACGVKTNNGTIGMNKDGVTHHSILEALALKGWRTGLVVTSTISHATPASFGSHVASRGSEADIAVQLLENRIGVMFGGGRKHWLPDGLNGGTRKDNQNLIEQARGYGYAVAYSKEQMEQLTEGPVLGLFADDGLKTLRPEPMLAEMAAKAISLLNKPGREWFAPKPKFFMMVEGSQIDWAGHDNDTDNSIRQTLLFDMAVRNVVEFAMKDRHTLVIVTADHETGGLQLRASSSQPTRFKADWHSKGHSGADVPLYAFGPGSRAFAGVQDNTEIPQKIAALAGVKVFPAVKTTAEAASKN
ncbi:MAG: alkaline phosphatase [Anaerohalosphaeraceae bacterium]